MSEIKSTLVDFVKVLRNADIKVSPAETLDAMDTMHLVGLKNRAFLKTSLSMALSKTPEEKEAFFQCFERIGGPSWLQNSQICRSWGHLGCKLRDLGVILGPSWARLGPRWSKMEVKRAKIEQDRAKMGQVGPR